MEISEIIKGLRVCARGDGCQSCPLENHPEIPGNQCDGQLMREAADNLEKLNDFEHSQLAIVMAENAVLQKALELACEHFTGQSMELPSTQYFHDKFLEQARKPEGGTP